MELQGDLPPILGRVSASGGAPPAAVIAVGVLIAGLVAIGSVEIAWAFSAFTVLVYYALSNLAALRLPSEQRLYPRWIAVAGLAACLFLAFWIPAAIWAAGLAVIAAGLIWKAIMPNFWRVCEAND